MAPAGPYNASMRSACRMGNWAPMDPRDTGLDGYVVDQYFHILIAGKPAHQEGFALNGIAGLGDADPGAARSTSPRVTNPLRRISSPVITHTVKGC